MHFSWGKYIGINDEDDDIDSIDNIPSELKNIIPSELTNILYAALEPMKTIIIALFLLLMLLKNIKRS